VSLFAFPNAKLHLAQDSADPPYGGSWALEAETVTHSHAGALMQLALHDLGPTEGPRSVAVELTADQAIVLRNFLNTAIQIHDRKPADD
jgi:hypothetical protein